MDNAQPAVSEIVDRVVHAILAGRLRPGTRLGETQLAQLFGVSRARVREALMRLETRGVVQVSARRGWFVFEPSLQDARDAFAARRAVEVGLLYCSRDVPALALTALKAHIDRERHAIQANDVGARSFLLGDFHVCLAESLGNKPLADILRDLTARTVLTAMLYQSQHDATASCGDHERIVSAIEAGEIAEAARLMEAHIGDVEAALGVRSEPDPLSSLRDALAPALVPLKGATESPVAAAAVTHVVPPVVPVKRAAARSRKQSNH